VTVLNGRIHKIIQKVEGGVTFHTAASKAIPQPASGTAPAPGPDEGGAGGELHAGEYRRGIGKPNDGPRRDRRGARSNHPEALVWSKCDVSAIIPFPLHNDFRNE
jgi:hypothetical protein